MADFSTSGIAMFLRALWPRVFKGMKFPDTPEALSSMLIERATGYTIEQLKSEQARVIAMGEEYLAIQRANAECLQFLRAEIEAIRYGNNGNSHHDEGSIGGTRLLARADGTPGSDATRTESGKTGDRPGRCGDSGSGSARSDSGSGGGDSRSECASDRCTD